MVNLNKIKKVLNYRYIKENYHRFHKIFYRIFIINNLLKAQYLLYIIGVYKFQNFRNLHSLKNKHNGETIYIIGNGPSLKDINFDWFSDKITLASNKIFLSYDNTSWRPSYYFVEDDLVIKQNIAEIKKLDPSNMFLASACLAETKRIPKATYFILKQNHFYPNLPNFSNNISRSVFWGSSVTYSQLQFAAYMGASKVVMLGIDFSFHIPKKSKDSSKEIMSEGEVNHFHKNYRKPGEKWNVPNLDYQILSFKSAKKYY